jgi:hypothetical protein
LPLARVTHRSALFDCFDESEENCQEQLLESFLAASDALNGLMHQVANKT